MTLMKTYAISYQQTCYLSGEKTPLTVYKEAYQNHLEIFMMAYVLIKNNVKDIAEK